MGGAHRCLLAICFLVSCSLQAIAEDIVSEGSAVIANGDVASARELAIRRAIARGVESRGAVVSGQTTVGRGMAFESAQVRATGCASQSSLIGEVVRGTEIMVTVRVSIAEPGSCAQVCRRATTNRIAVTAFAMEFPEQLLMSERGAVTTLTAMELARFINKRRLLPAVYDTTFFPYVSPSRAPMQRSTSTGRLLTVYYSHKQAAQYVLAGIYRDFGISGRARRIEIEAFLHDGANGAVLARRNFSRIAEGNILLGDSGHIGSPEFYRGDLGRAWGALYDDIAAWVESSASCLPFLARVIKMQQGQQLQIDAGAESVLSIGDTLNLHQWKEPPIRSESMVLGREKFVRATVRIRSVYPNFSIGELVEAPKGLEVVPGDVLYAD